MPMSDRIHTSTTVLLILAIMLLSAAGCGDDNNSGPTSTCDNIAGTWQVVVGNPDTGCGTGWSDSWIITQSGCNLNIVTNVSSGSGDAHDNRVYANWVWDVGIYHTQYNLEATVSGDSMTGQLFIHHHDTSWTTVCAGTSSVTGTR
jgi:hypothetical protein